MIKPFRLESKLGMIVWGLALGQALLISGNILLVSVTALIGLSIAPSPAYATVPVAAQFIGVMAITLPASFLVKFLGRKAVFLIGNLLGLGGAALAYFAIANNLFWIFTLGTTILGFAIGIAQQYRFAAVENCHPEYSAQAVSVIMAGGILAAILGPNLAVWSEFIIPHTQYLGAFAALFVLYVFTTILVASLPLKPVNISEQTGATRSYKALLQQPKLIAAITAGVIGYGVMVLVMTATPLAMGSCGFNFDNTANVIQWHVLGMFAPSFFTGRLIGKYGLSKIIQTGCVLLLLCVILNQFGQGYWHFWASLVLLGIGWNFTFIGATTMLTTTYKPAEKAKVQGLNDFLVFSSAAIASIFAGYLQSTFSWEVLNLWMLPFILVAMFTVFIQNK